MRSLTPLFIVLMVVPGFVRAKPIAVELPEMVPTLQQYLEARGYASNLESLREGKDAFAEGDELVFLAEMREGAARSQWLVRLEWINDQGSQGKNVKRFASTGDVFEYSTDKGVISVTTIGPVSANSVEEPASVADSIEVEMDYLRLGFHESTALWAEMDRRRAANPELPRFWFYTNRTKPVDDATVAQQQSIMAAYGVTHEQLRALSGLGVAFDAFFAQLNRTPGVSDIMWKIAKKPSLFSLVRGLRTDVSNYESDLAVGPAAWGLPSDADCLTNSLLVKLNGRPGMRVDLFVLPPRGVLLASAGVVGLIARPGESSDDKMLVIRLMGAKRADPAGKGT